VYIHAYFLPVLCKWQIIIFFPLVNQIFNLEFITQHFVYNNFLLISLRVLLRCSLNRKLIVSSHFGAELVLSDCGLFLVGFRELGTYTVSHSS